LLRRGIKISLNLPQRAGALESLMKTLFKVSAKALGRLKVLCAIIVPMSLGPYGTKPDYNKLASLELNSARKECNKLLKKIAAC
jgi:hypothetical protein